MHPELFELKALVAGRLDAHRRREIDDHLGSCADCSRHYVALMLGSSSPKTAEAEAREGLVPTGSGTEITLGGNSPAVVRVYGIDAPLAPPTPRAPRSANGHGPALEAEFASGPARTQVPVSASLVDAIAKLRAESEAQKLSAPAAAPVSRLAPEVVAPVAESPLIEPSIFTPTPPDGISIIRATSTTSTPSTTRTPPERPSFMTRPSPASSTAQPELVVTFSSTPTRASSYRSPSSVAVVTPSADREYVSQAVPNLATHSHSDFHVAETTVARKPQSIALGVIVGGAALACVLAFSGYKYFQSTVASAASAAAAAATQQVKAAAATNKPATPVVVTAPGPVQTRIVYVREPARKSDSRPSVSPSSSATPALPANVVLPDVNVSTGSAESVIQGNSQRSATSELGRSARATAIRTAAPRP